MKVSNRIIKNLALGLSIITMMPALAVEPAAQMPTAQELQQQQAFFDQILQQRIKLFQPIDRVLEDLLLLVTGRSIQVNKKDEFIGNVHALKDFIKSINDEPFLNVDLGTLQLLSTINKAMVQHIIKALDNNMTDFPIFPVDQVIQRHKPNFEVTAEDLENDLKKSAELVATMQEKATTAGLRWYNKAYRVLDNNVIQPAAKYNVPLRGGLALAGGFLAASTLFRSDNFEWAPFRDRYGWYPHFIGGSHTLDPVFHKDHPIKNLGHAAKWGIELYHGHAPHEVLTYGAIAVYVAMEREKIKNYFGKKITKLHNFLKGGTYSEKPEDKFLINPRVTFKDLVGLDHAKETLSFIVNYMENPEKFDRAKLTPEKGYILTGPTRTGKSFMAEALAGEIKEMYKRKNKNPEDFNFFVLTSNFIISEGIDALIERAKKFAPCIFFIDEIDLLGLQRAGGNSELLSRFLSSMSGCLESDPDKVIIMIAATNKPENLDQALRQPGRFGKEIRFEYPAFKERKEFMSKRIGSLASINAFDIDQLVRETEGQSFEKINSMIKNAFQKGIIKGESLTQQALEQSLDEVVREIIMSDLAEISQEEKQILAAHQAGKALAIMHLGTNEKLAKVMIKPYLTKLREEAAWEHFNQNDNDKQKKIKYGNSYTYHVHDVKDLHALKDKVVQSKIKLAGFAAEEILLGSCGYGYNTEDSQFALEVAKSVVSQGINLKDLPDDIKRDYLNRAIKLKQQWADEVKAMLLQNNDKLQALADALARQHVVTGQEAAKIAGLPYQKVVTPNTQQIRQELGINEVPANGSAAPAA